MSKKEPTQTEAAVAVPRIVIGVVVAYIAIMAALCVAQFYLFIYDGWDLGIFSQVVWNTSQGRFFEFSFSPFTYLVDHRAWILLLIAPLYLVAAHPITLVVLQVIVMAFGAVPLYLLTLHVLQEEKRATETKSGQWKKYKPEHVGLFAVVAYLIYPTVLSIQLSEFHVLSFVLPLTLWLWYAVVKSHWKMVWVVFALLLLVREDVALMTSGIGLLLLLTNKFKEKRNWLRASIMTGVSALWFIGMMVLGAVLSPEKSPRFLSLYEWLPGAGASEFIAVVLGYDHLIVVLLLLAGVVFLPLLRIRYLIPAVAPLFLHLLVAGPIVRFIFVHYAALVLPWLFIAAVYGFARLQQWIRTRPSQHWIFRIDLRLVLPVFIGTILLAQSVVIGPAPFKVHQYSLVKDRNLAEYLEAVQLVGEDDAVLVSNRLWTHLSKRTGFYPSKHIIRGKEHLLDTDYTLPSRVDWVMLEHETLLRADISISFEERADAWQRLRSLLDNNRLELVRLTEDMVIFGPRGASEGEEMLWQDAKVLANPVIETSGAVQLVSWEYVAGSDEVSESEMSLDGGGDLYLQFEKMAVADVDYHFRVRWKDSGGNVVKEKIFALGFGIDPTHAWDVGLEARRKVRVPLQHTPAATVIELSVGPVEKEIDRVFVVGISDFALDEDEAATVLLQGAI
ncbi:DUF2079 domain-containing protein [Patescibacteria group bacterium]